VKLENDVSILIPVYGESEFLMQAINSVKDQVFPGEWEIVVVHKNSYLSLIPLINDPKIILLEQKSEGISNALNEGIASCQYPFVARLDSDDLMTVGRIKRQLQEFQNRCDLVAIGGQSTIIDDLGNQIGSIKYPVGTKLVNWALSFSSPIAHPAATIKKTALEQLGGYRPGYLHAEDHDLWVRLALIGEIDNLPTTVLQYRRHLKQLTTSNINKTLRASAAIIAISNSKKPKRILDYQTTKEIESALTQLTSKYFEFFKLSKSKKFLPLFLLIIRQKELRILFLKKALLKIYYLLKSLKVNQIYVRIKKRLK
jgi:glycosyltransferase involved in cell wall biosynthesis